MQTLRFAQLKQKVPLSRTQIWRLENQGLFPKRFKLTENTVAWDSAEIDDWLKERKEASHA